LPILEDRLPDFTRGGIQARVHCVKIAGYADTEQYADESVAVGGAR
jgi:hypothetical protein